MLKDNFLSIWSIAKYDYKKLSLNPRLYILIILQFMYLWYLISPITQLSKNLHVRVTPWLFTHITSYRYSQLILMLGIIILFANSPFIEEEYNYLIIRSGKKKWVLGQIFYMITATALYFIVIFLLTVILVLPNIYPSFEWGKIITTIANTNATEQIELVINSKILLTYSPLTATVLSFIISWAAGSILALIMFLINLRCKNFVGIIAAIFIVFLDRAIFSNFPNFKLAYISPVSLSNLSGLNISSQGISPTVSYSIVFLLVSLVVLSILAVLSVRKKTTILSME